MIASNWNLVGCLILGWRFQKWTFECLQRIFFLEILGISENLKNYPIKQKFGKLTNFGVTDFKNTTFEFLQTIVFLELPGMAENLTNDRIKLNCDW